MKAADSSLRIAFLDSWRTEPSEGSGTTVAISALAKGLKHLGHRITTFRSERSCGSFLLNRLVYNFGLPGKLDPQSFDLVVGFDWDGFLLPPSGLNKYVVCLKGILADEAVFEKGWSRFQLKMLSQIEKLNAKKARQVVVTSHYCRRVAASRYGLKSSDIAVVPEPIDLQLWNLPDLTAPEDESICRRAGLAKPALENAASQIEMRRSGKIEPARGMVGRLSPNGEAMLLSVAHQYARKNTRDLLAALPPVLKRFPGTKLRVVGGGPELPALKRQASALGISSKVRFLEAMPVNGLVRAQYRRCNIFCLPSLQEGFGIVFLEAMAAGLPIVATRAGAIPEVVRDGEVGLLTPPGDVPALSRAIMRLIEDKKLRSKLGEAGRRRVQGYSVDQVAAQFLKECYPGVKQSPK